MGLSASQGRLLLLTARRSDLEFRAQNIAHRRIGLSQQLEAIATEYENATTNKHMYLKGNLTSSGANASQNLTYATLMANALKNKGYAAGVIGSSAIGTDNIDFVANGSAMRLVDNKGRVAIADPSEIPGYTSNDNKCNVNQFGYTVENGKKDEIASALQSGSTAYAATVGGNDYIKIGNDFYGTDGQKVIDDGSDLYKNLQTAQWKDTECFVGKVPSTTGETDPVVGLRMAGSTDNATIDLLDITESTDNGFTTYHVTCGDQLVGDYICIPELKQDSDSKTGDINYLQKMLLVGFLQLQTYGATDAGEGDPGWNPLSDYGLMITEENYTGDDNEAEAKYKKDTQKIQNQDKKLELELSQIQTQRSAVTTEIDSVKKVIDDNVQSTFKIFS